MFKDTNSRVGKFIYNHNCFVISMTQNRARTFPKDRTSFYYMDRMESFIRDLTANDWESDLEISHIPLLFEHDFVAGF